jgi:DNA-directed RNA polymerase specialized sigma24 family protein
MEQPHEDNVIVMGQQSSWEWAKLIRKLHWIGLHDEARRLEQAVSTLPPEERSTVLLEPLNTD